MHLLIDAGNTRVKWACLGAEGLHSQQQLSREEFASTEPFIGLGRVERVLVSNVAGPEFAEQLRQTTKHRFAQVPEFVAVQSAAHGVYNGYKNPSQMGVDRWLAVIAAYQLTHDLVCVADVGTAMTLDAVDSVGQHMGGLIMPSVRLMMHSLAISTSDIGTYEVSKASLFASDTGSAVYGGAVHACGALVERFYDGLEARFGKTPRLLFTGGDARVIAAAVERPSEVFPDLVLRGLALFAEVER